MDGSDVASGDPVTAGADGLTATAVAKTGYTFWRWQTDSGYDYNNPLTVLPSANMTVKAEFIQENTAIFGVGSERFNNLTEAANAANAGSTKQLSC